MRIFFDTEFTDFSAPRLISVGLVSEDGREFYVELTDGWLPEHCTEFVVDVVLPLLGDKSAPRMTRDVAGERLAQWLAGFDGPVTVIYDTETDWRLLSQILWPWQDVVAVEGVPLGWPGFAMARHHEDLLEALLQGDPRRHHALVDARALRESVLQTEAEFQT